MRKNILIVDDSSFDRELMAKALAAKSDFQTLEASTGEECMDTLARSSVDLILLDIMMPGVLGTQTLMRIREQFNPIELPIIMVTAKGDPLDIVGCLRSGANDYVSKPIQFEVAISRISTHLMLAEVSREMARNRELATLGAMVASYNHEINNPLAVAIQCVESSSLENKKLNEDLQSSLWRIADIVKRIGAVVESKNVEFEKYTESVDMLKLFSTAQNSRKKSK